MKKIITIILCVMLLFSFVGCENYLNERQLSHRKFKGEYFDTVNYIMSDIDIEEYRLFRLNRFDKIENGKLWYFCADKDNSQRYIYESREIGVIDQVLYDGITEIINVVGRRVEYTKNGIILSSGEKIIFGEETRPIKDRYNTLISSTNCTFRDGACEVRKAVCRAYDTNEIEARMFSIIIEKYILDSKGVEVSVTLYFEFIKTEK